MSATKVPAEKSPIAVAYIVRVEKRLRRNPVVGMTTAIVSMNAVVSHCASTAVIPRSPMRWGIATPIVVSLRIATKAAASSSQMTRFSFAPTVADEVRSRSVSTDAMGTPEVIEGGCCADEDACGVSRDRRNRRSHREPQR